MDLIKIQKEIAKEVLEELEVIDPHCILAGGAPRDWFFNKPASDLDFYVYDPLNLSQKAWMDRLSKTLLDVKPLGMVEGKSDKDVEEEYTAMKDLRYVYEGEYMGVIVQVMVMNMPTFTSVIDNFCVENSKIWWKGGQLHPSWEFLVSHATRTIKVCKEHAPKQRYLDKMVKKFPTYKLITGDSEYSERVEVIKSLLGATEDYEVIEKVFEDNLNIKRGVSLPFFFGW